MTGEVSAPGIAVPIRNPHRRGEAAPHVLVRMYGEERDRLVRYARACIDAGVAERLVRLAERQGGLLVGVVEAALADRELGLSEKQREVGRGVFARHLQRIGP